jgi:hypothetical protein
MAHGRRETRPYQQIMLCIVEYHVQRPTVHKDLVQPDDVLVGDLAAYLQAAPCHLPSINSSTQSTAISRQADWDTPESVPVVSLGLSSLNLLIANKWPSSACLGTKLERQSDKHPLLAPYRCRAL